MRNKHSFISEVSNRRSLYLLNHKWHDSLGADNNIKYGAGIEQLANAQ